MEWIEKIIAIFKLPLKTIVVISVICGLILFLPTEFLEKMKLSELVSEYGKYFGIIFLITFCYSVVAFIILFWKNVKKWKMKKDYITTACKALTELTNPEIYLLREFLIQDKDVIEVPYESTEFTSLYNKGILVIASKKMRSFIFGHFISVTINPEIKKFITEDVLKLSKNPTQKDVDEVMQSRPNFLTSLNYINNLMDNFGHIGRIL
jgi:hypothetical protein